MEKRIRASLYTCLFGSKRANEQVKAMRYIYIMFAIRVCVRARISYFLLNICAMLHRGTYDTPSRKVHFPKSASDSRARSIDPQPLGRAVYQDKSESS